jgi:hypothetical protein
MCKLRAGGHLVKHLLALILVAACSGGTKSSPPPMTPPAGDPPVAQAPTNGCSKDIAIRCKAPGVDGCTNGLTTEHVCVAEGETAGPPCSQELAKQCPEGQEDACLRQPAVATTHVCILK